MVSCRDCLAGLVLVAAGGSALLGSDSSVERFAPFPVVTRRARVRVSPRIPVTRRGRRLAPVAS